MAALTVTPAVRLAAVSQTASAWTDKGKSANDATALLPANKAQLLQSLLFQGKEARISHGSEEHGGQLIPVILIAVDLPAHSST